MVLGENAQKVLEVLVEEYENNPKTRLEGIPDKILGAKAGIFLNNPMFEIEELENEGFVSRLRGGRTILTNKGYNYLKPIGKRVIQVSLPVVIGIIGIFLTVIGILVTIIVSK